MREVIGAYQNGNYTVRILSDGTKIRQTDDDKFIPDRPESFDILLTKSCDMNCSYCHEAATPDGKHGEIMDANFMRYIKPYTELAIGGGNVLEHPDFIPFLELCKEKKLIPSITLHQEHFMKNLDLLSDLRDRKLIYGLGVSLVYPTDEFVNAVREFPNAVIHIIAGIVSKTSLEKLYSRGLKLLILGYKQFRKGKTHYKSSVDTQVRIDCGINWLKDNIKDIISKFDVVSFDNLAIKQLDIKSIMSPEEWDQFYMGDDGQFTMYIDTVNKEFAVSSTSKKRYPYTDETMEEMFNVVRSEMGYDA